MEAGHAFIANVTRSPEKQENPAAIQVAGGQISDSAGTLQVVGGQISNSDDAQTLTKVDASCGIQIHGRRISKSAGGKLCHQLNVLKCRQYKTFLVSCKNQQKKKPCRINVCRKCLWNRYGDQPEKVDALPDWLCPKCRGTCNCSICMKRRGLQPTGSLHKEAKADKRVGSAVAASASPHKEVLLLTWTEDWEKMNAGISVEESKKDAVGDEMKKSGEGQ